MAVLNRSVVLEMREGEYYDKASFAECTIYNCYYEQTRSRSDYAPTSSAKLYVFDRKSIVTDAYGNHLAFVPESEYSSYQSSGVWCLRVGDYFKTQDGNRYKITSVTHYEAGSPRMHHWEVDGNRER